jgi:hypothetical protein
MALPVRIEKPKRKNKYGAKRTVAHGITFDSKAEADRYCELRLLERAGEITDLECQPQFALTIEGVDCGKYIADFGYFSRPTNTKRGEHIIEDCKGVRTAVYKLKKRIVAALYHVQIIEVA